MPGSLLDLSQPEVQLPEFVVMDSSVIIDWLDATYVTGGTLQPLKPKHQQALQFFRALQSGGTVGCVTSVGFNEVFHVLLRRRFASEIPNHLGDLSRAFPHLRNPKSYRWNHLYKVRSDLLTGFVNNFAQIRLFMISSNLIFLQPRHLAPLPGGKDLEEEVLDLMARHQLDSGDASILLEAQRAGVRSIVTSDTDLHRAQSDFHVYTWL